MDDTTERKEELSRIKGTRASEEPDAADVDHEGAPSVESEQGPGAPERERGTKGLQGKFRRDE